MRSFTPHARKALCLQRIRRRPPTFSGHWGPPWAQGTGASCGRAPVLPDRDCLRALGACRCVSGSAVVLDPPPRATTHRAALLCPRGRSASLVLRALHAPPPRPRSYFPRALSGAHRARWSIAPAWTCALLNSPGEPGPCHRAGEVQYILRGGMGGSPITTDLCQSDPSTCSRFIIPPCNGPWLLPVAGTYVHALCADMCVRARARGLQTHR